MASTIIVPNYPSTNRTPGVFFGVDNSNANTASPLLTTLLIGQMTSSGAATANQPVLATGQSAVNALVGINSMLANQYAAYVGDDAFGQVWLLPVDDASGGTAAVYTATVTGPATGSGTLALYICGVSVPVAVTSGDTATVIASNIVAAIALVPTLPLAASATAGVVTITAVHKGLVAGDVDLRLNFVGPIAGEVTPAGVAVAFANTTVGATDPTLTTALANLTASYAFICNPYSGSAQVGEVQEIQSDVNGTWSWLSNTGGGQFSAIKGTYSANQTYGATNNLQHLSVIAFTNTPTPVWAIAADYTAICANSLRVDPSLPLTQIIMTQVLCPPLSSQYTRLERNGLLYDGLATWTANSAGQVILERAVTTYQTNTAGAPDDSYLDVTSLYILEAIVTLWKVAFQSKYARCKIVNNATPILPGTSTVSPNTIQSEVIAQYQIAVNNGWAQDVGTFSQNVTVQQSTENVNTVLIYAPVQLSTALFMTAIDLAFTL